MSLYDYNEQWLDYYFNPTKTLVDYINKIIDEEVTRVAYVNAMVVINNMKEIKRYNKYMKCFFGGCNKKQLNKVPYCGYHYEINKKQHNEEIIFYHNSLTELNKCEKGDCVYAKFKR